LNSFDFALAEVPAAEFRTWTEALLGGEGIGDDDDDDDDDDDESTHSEEADMEQEGVSEEVEEDE
jgi:hypothetical protein